MIKAIRTCCCDRCGEKIEENSPFWCKTPHHKTAIKILFNEWRYADLSDNCKESFITWWDKSSASPTVAEEVEE